MSFSSQVKDELCHSQVSDKNIAKAELFASLASLGSITIRNRDLSLRLSYENLHAARRMYQFLSDFFDVPCDISIIKNNLKGANSYSLDIDGKDNVLLLLEKIGFDTENIFFLKPILDEELFSDLNICSAFLRGLFLSCGSVTHPQKNYHLEFVTAKESFCGIIIDVLKKFGLSGKILPRKTSYVVYLKGGNNISSFLAAVGANEAVMELENIMIVKDIRNNINRAVNCETANISKTIDAAAKQIRCIKSISDTVGLKSLGPALAEIAQLRLDNPDLTLLELASKAGLTKSGVNHKLRKICKIANELNP